MNDTERAVLAFEELHPRNDRTKEADIRNELGMSWVRYRQLLGKLVQRPDVLSEFAVVAHRVQRSTDDATQQRAARSFNLSVTR